MDLELREREMGASHANERAAAAVMAGGLAGWHDADGVWVWCDWCE